MASTTSTPGAQPPLAETPSVLVSMPLEDSGMMAQLIASEGNCQRTNQALIGTNVSMLLLAVLFFTYRYFKKAKSGTKQTLANDSDGYDMIHPINDARAVDDGFHGGWMSEDAAKARFTLGLHLPSWRPHFFSTPWLWRTRGGDRSKEGAAEEGKPSLSSNNLPGPISSRRERASDASSLVSALIQVSDQHNIGPVDARPPFADEDESTNLAPRVTLGNGDRRSRGQTPHVPDSTQTQTITVSSSHEVEPIMTHPFAVKASGNGREGTATATSSPRAQRHTGLRKPSPFAPAPTPIGSGTAPPSAFRSLDIQGTGLRGDISSIPSLPSYQHNPDNAEGGTSPTPSSPPSPYDPHLLHLLRESNPPVPALPSTDGAATPATPRAEGGKTQLMSSYTPASRTSTLQSTWSDTSTTPSVPSFQRPVRSEGGGATPTPSSPPSLYGHDWLRVPRGLALLDVSSAAAPSSVEDGGTTPTAEIAAADPRHTHTLARPTLVCPTLSCVAMASTLTNTTTDSVPSFTSSAQTTPVHASDMPSIPSQIVWMPNPDTSILAQLIASEASYQRTNQVLFGTNVTILLMAALFVAYRGFKKAKSRTATAKAATSESWGCDDLHPLHPAVGTRAADDRLHTAAWVAHDASPRSPGIGWVSEETLTSPSSMTSRIPLRGRRYPKWRSRFFSSARWAWRTRGGQQSTAGSEGRRTFPTLNGLSYNISKRWYGFLERGRGAFARVSAFPAKSSTTQRNSSISNIGSVEVPPILENGERDRLNHPLHSASVDRRPRERSLPIPHSARTTTFSTNSSVPTLPPYRQSLDSADGSMSPTPSSPSACCHDRRLRESTFPPIPALPDIGSIAALALPPPLRAAGEGETATVGFPHPHSDSRRPRARERSLPALPRLSITPVSSDVSISA
ncbi:hypothetical protein CCMSSC00406_0006885 [Pleurotus cornucopiae]|uniref:Uncharacterized protein n=1 Tax=Pleurotus cornucopiae TaxID=5321 RepID=A0ACB7IP12_PLECO|nr:hypothetical protein CCMSSC00406_0006885 [Pleurotus cornucopiae]